MFCYRRKAHYHETDQMGVVHHSNYVKWMEEARIEFMRESGANYKTMEEAGVFSPVVSLSVDYKRPVEFDDTVEVRVSASKYNGVVLEVSYEFYTLTKDELCGTAQSKHCFLKDGRPVSLKRTMPEADNIFRAMAE